MIAWGADVRAIDGAPVELPSVPGLDPYAVWAVATGWRFQWHVQPASALQRAIGMPDKVPVLARMDMPKGQAPTQAAELLQPLRKQGWQVPAVYDALSMGGDRPTIWFTARVPRERMAELLMDPQDGLRWELAVPLREPVTVARAHPLGLYGERDEAAYALSERPFDDAGKTAADEATRDAKRRLRSALAVVDFGCAFLHTQFREFPNRRALLPAAGDAPVETTRLHAVWDQGASAPSEPRSWRCPESVGYGREIRKPAIDGILEHLLRGDDDESDAYRQLDHLIDYDDARRRLWVATHGTHVLHVAGGQSDPLVPGSGTRKPTAASMAPLVFVQVPSLTASDCSGASMGAAVLDGLHYILTQCEDEARVVVNLSHGTYAGPHDGSTLFEQALDDLLQRRRRLAVVLAAGNARLREGHVRRTVRPDRSARLRVELAPGDSTPTFVEIWYLVRSEPGGRRLTGGNDLMELRVRSDDGDWSAWVRPGQAQFLCERPRGGPLAMARNQHPAAQVPGAGPDEKEMMLVAFAPTMRPSDDDGPLAPAGVWEIEVRLPEDTRARSGDRWAQLDAWVERDDPGDFSRGAQPRLLGVDADDAGESLSSQCGGPRVIVAGGFRLRDGLQASYSSVGHTRGVLVMGACEESRSCPGIHAAAVRSGETFLMNGTSVAAPVVARRLYDWMIAAEDKAFDPDGEWRRRAIEDIVRDEHEDGGSGAVKHWPA